MRFVFIFFILFLSFNKSVCQLAAENIPAVVSQWFSTEHGQVRIISASTGYSEDNTILLGLQFELAEDWKIYWKQPGESGLPPKLDWHKSTNIKKATVNWPMPIRFDSQGLSTIGYQDEVILPIDVTVTNSKKPLILRTKLNYLTCNKICIPYETKLNLDIMPSKPQPTKHLQLIKSFYDRVPKNDERGKVSTKTLQVGPGAIKVGNNTIEGTLIVKFESQKPFIRPDVFLEGPNSILFSEPTISTSENRSTLKALIPFEIDTKKNSITENITFTIADRNFGLLKRELVEFSLPKFGITKNTGLSFILIIGLAFLGGLILNLMPCVLPVLALKIFSFLSTGAQETQKIRVNFLYTSLGIVFSFLGLATTVLILNRIGATVGWGIQFQQPWFIIGLVIIVSLFALNVFGLFDIRLPIWVNEFLNKDKFGDKTKNNFLKHFGTGVFATLLATPCSAPFVGTAVGFALAGTPVEILSIFFVLGIGMSTPFLLIAAFPLLARKLPRPGKWTSYIKYLLGLALAATSGWLLFIISHQLSLNAAIILSSVILLICLILMARNVLKIFQGLTGNIVIICGLVFAFVIPTIIDSDQNVPEVNTPKAYWTDFEPNKIPSYIEEGKIVFVDLTAKWCVTCQFNKRLVLDRKIITEKLSDKNNVVAMRGDWTQPDLRISSYLKTFDRYGIPFNVIYGPNSKSGIILPELLTLNNVLEKFRQAKQKN